MEEIEKKRIFFKYIQPSSRVSFSYNADLINCRLDACSILATSRKRYSEYDDEEDGKDEISCRDPLLELLAANREYLEKGDCRLLYGIWLEYWDQENDESAPPETEMTRLPAATTKLLSLMEQP